MGQALQSERKTYRVWTSTCISRDSGLKGRHLQGQKGIHLYLTTHFKKFGSRNLEELEITDLTDSKNLKYEPVVWKANKKPTDSSHRI